MTAVPARLLAAAVLLLLAGPSHGADAVQAGDKNDVPRLIVQGRRYLDLGKTNEAEFQWLVALQLDPANPYARQYLAAIGRTNVATVTPEPAAATPPVRVHTGVGRQKIYAKLDSIRFDSVEYDNIPLSEVIKVIDHQTVKRDPDQKGINILISSTAEPSPARAPTIDPLTGLPVAATAENDVGSTAIKISPPQRDITLHQLLDILVLVADQPIKYSVLDSGIVITRRNEESLSTRWYKIDPNTFLNGLQGVVNQQFGSSSQRTGNANGSAQAAGVSVVASAVSQNSSPGTPSIGRQPQGGSGEINYTAIQSSQDAALQTIKGNLLQLGLNFTRPPRSVVFNDRLGMLMVRGTQADLERMDAIIQQCNSLPGIEGTPR